FSTLTLNPDTAECAATYVRAAVITASFSFASTNEPPKVIARTVDISEKARARRAMEFPALIFIRLLFLHNVTKDQSKRNHSRHQSRRGKSDESKCRSCLNSSENYQEDKKV